MPDDEFDVGIDLPPLVSAADLAPPEEEEVPPGPGESQPPPETVPHGQFTVGKDYRSCYIVHESDVIEALGLWLAREHPATPGADLAAMLEAMGLPQKSAVWYGRQRTQMQEGEAALADHPGLVRLADEEQKHYERKDEFSRAFVAAQNRKKGSK